MGPVANNGSLNTNEDVAASGALGAGDVDGDTLSYAIVTNGVKGTAVITNAATGDYSYTPNTNVNGLDSFTFRVNDGQVDSSTATVSVDIAALNDEPIANDGNLNTSEDMVVNAVLSASDVDGDTLSYAIVTNGAKGTAVITNAATGTYIYTPNPGATGADSFSFKASDGRGDSNIAVISVNLAAVNDAPVADDGSIDTSEDVPANGTLSASDADGDTLGYAIMTNGVKGTAVITNAATGTYVYTPNADANGQDSFTFKVTDGQIESSIATITVNLTAVNDPPVANNGILSTIENRAVNGTLSVSDVDGDTQNISIVSDGSMGAAVITNAATGAYTYTPDPGATGADSFTFKSSDGLADSNTAMITINIALVNFEPVASNGSLETQMNTTGTGILIAIDGDGDTLVYSIVSMD